MNGQFNYILQLEVGTHWFMCLCQI